MSERAAIFAAVRGSIAKKETTSLAERAATALARISSKPRGTIPARSQKPLAELADDFAARVEVLSGTVARLSSLDDVPEALADYLRTHNLPQSVICAPHDDLADLDWSGAPMIDRKVGIPNGSERVGLNVAYRAVAETGTLAMSSGPQSPTTLNFLPEVHVVVVKQSDLVGPYEDALDAIRAQHGGSMPRSVNFITGPSRTGDIEQKILLGAHGPKALHVLLVEGA